MQGWIDAAIEFVAVNQRWTPILMLIFAAAETTAVISILIPSTAILMSIGAMVASGAIPFFPLWVGASVGALVGSTFSFWLGRRYGSLILSIYPLRNHPHLVDRTKDAFAKWGPVTVFLGHFIGPLRPVVFLFAGMSGMGLFRFMIFNVTGALAWAYLVPKIGEVGGGLIGWLWQFLPF